MLQHDYLISILFILVSLKMLVQSVFQTDEDIQRETYTTLWQGILKEQGGRGESRRW